MAAHKSVKATPTRPRVVGVITTPRELRLAARMSRPPDLFEIRLDHLILVQDELERKMSILNSRNRSELPAPIIITARHPLEGGANRLSIKQRREVLLRFLPHARYVDVELRSINALRSVLDLARKKNIARIISFHDFKSTPPIQSMLAKARAAKKNGGDIFKVATRTDTRAQFARLRAFAANADVDLPFAVMGIGRLGRKSRREINSILIYARLGRKRIAGQPSLFEIRHWLRFASPA